MDTVIPTNDGVVLVSGVIPASPQDTKRPRQQQAHFLGFFHQWPRGWLPQQDQRVRTCRWVYGNAVLTVKIEQHLQDPLRRRNSANRCGSGILDERSFDRCSDSIVGMRPSDHRQKTQTRNLPPKVIQRRPRAHWHDRLRHEVELPQMPHGTAFCGVQKGRSLGDYGWLAGRSALYLQYSTVRCWGHSRCGVDGNWGLARRE